MYAYTPPRVCSIISMSPFSIRVDFRSDALSSHADLAYPPPPTHTPPRNSNPRQLSTVFYICRHYFLRVLVDIQQGQHRLAVYCRHILCDCVSLFSAHVDFRSGALSSHADLASLPEQQTPRASLIGDGPSALGGSAYADESKVRHIYSVSFSDWLSWDLTWSA